MNIKVKFFADLRNRFGKESACRLPEGSTIADLFKQVELPEELTRIVLVNGKSIEGNMNYGLCDKDTVSIFPPVGGG